MTKNSCSLACLTQRSFKIKMNTLAHYGIAEKKAVLLDRDRNKCSEVKKKTGCRRTLRRLIL